MRNHVQVAVIGGGVVGASVLYHLTKAGWKDVLLIERAELTSGSTWHAAGGMHTVNGDPNVAKLQQYTIELYKEIEQISGVSCGVHITGGLMLAGTPERVDWLRMAVARGRYLGMDLQLITPAEAKAMYPLLDEQHFLGAIYDPIEGHVDPYGVTHAYAKSAQLAGAEIVRQNRVIDTKQRADGTWDVVTEKGTVHAEHVVNAGGLWAREVGRFVGLELPILAMEHQYFITEDLPELKGQKELLHVIDFEAEIYMRQERQGMLLGTYERAGVPWSPKTTPWDFGQDLLPNDLERIAPSVDGGIRAFPATRERRHQEGRQRAVHLRAGRQPAGRPDQGPQELLGGLRRHGRVQPGRRRGPVARELDGRWRSGRRHLGDGRRALRRLGQPSVHQRQGARELLATVPHPLPQRRTRGRAPAAHDADLREAAGRERRVRRLLHAGASAVVRAEGHASRRRRDVPALERTPPRRRRVSRSARILRPDRDLELRQVRDQRARAPRTGCQGSWHARYRPSVASRCRRCSTMPVA